MLVFPFMMKGRTFERILEDAMKKSIQINFDLAFSIAVAIADIVDMGSAIVVSGQKSFHGFLTPDNIFIDFDGKIALKNYGIFPFLERDDKISGEIEKKYGSWVTPEFLRKEKIVPQSDIFHLGYLIYRMLTGKYFSHSLKDDFESKLSSISFTSAIPPGDKAFVTNTVNLFKKTLNPDPAKRFSNIKEFKDYISTHFRIEELSSVTFNLAYFMHSIYLEDMEAETKFIKEEASYSIPTKKEVPEKVEEKETELVDSILSGIDERKGSKKKFQQ